MAESLDYVLQPDGSYKWQMVELRAEELYKVAEPEPEVMVRKYTRKTKETETEI
jgi:hypothetical protein